MSRWLTIPAILATVLVSGGAVSLLAQSRGETPLALLDAARSKESLRTARVEWVHKELDRSRPGDGVFTSRFYTWRAAPDRHASTYYGDEEGVLFRDAEGNPESAGYTFAGPGSCLQDTDGVWLHRAGSPGVEVWDAGLMDDLYGLKDLRMLGTEPQLSWATIEQRMAEAGLTPFRYSTSADGDLVVVRAETELAPDWTKPRDPGVRPFAFAWWLDPARDFNSVRIAAIVDDAIIYEHRITLANYDGSWYPRRVESWGGDDPGNLRLFSVTEVLSAEFNRPEHPRELGPADIGVEPGMAILDKRSGPGREPRVWDGTRPISNEEYSARRAEGALVPGPTVLRHEARFDALHARRRAERAAARAMAGAENTEDVAPPQQGAATQRDGHAAQGASAQTQPGPPEPGWESLAGPEEPDALRRWRRVDTLWEAYTRAFIARYRLDDEQAQRAWRACRECQDEARAHVERVRAELEQAEAVLAESRDAGAADEPRCQKARAELARLVQPLDEIFSRKLRPKLDKLPTRAQRAASEAAAGATSTQPADRPEPGASPAEAGR